MSLLIKGYSLTQSLSLTLIFLSYLLCSMFRFIKTLNFSYTFSAIKASVLPYSFLSIINASISRVYFLTLLESLGVKPSCCKSNLVKATSLALPLLTQKCGNKSVGLISVLSIKERLLGVLPLEFVFVAPCYKN